MSFLQRLWSKPKARKIFIRTAAMVIAAVLVVTSVPVTSHAVGKGTRGSNVYAIQGMLQTMGYFQGSITGYYGAVTEAAVRKFQTRYGLKATGYVDNDTLQSILWAYANYMLPEKKAAPQPTPQPAPPITPDANVPPLSAEEKEMLSYVNAERAKAGVPALAADTELARVARVKSKEMADKDYFSHDSPTYGSPFDMMRSFKIEFKAAGENIACNQTVSKAHTALMNSKGHRENILSSNFTHIGIGIVDGGVCGKMFTQMFIR